jgi:hypothetical protein
MPDSSSSCFSFSVLKRLMILNRLVLVALLCQRELMPTMMTEAFGGKQWVVAQPKPSNALAVLISSNKQQPTTTEVVLLQSPRRCSAKRTMGRSSTAVLIPDTQVIFETSTCNGGGNDNNNNNNNNNRNNNGGGRNNGNFHRWNDHHNNENNNNNEDGEGWYYYTSSSSYLYDTLLIPPVTKSATLGAIQRGISYNNNNSHRFLLPLLLQQWLQGQCYLVIETGKYLLQMYKFHLESNPLVTKSITSGIMGVMGDVLAQYVEHVRHEISARKLGGEGLTPDDHSSNDSSLAHGGNSSSQAPLMLNRGGGGRKKATSFHFNSRRSLAILLDGLLISGPLMHLAYNAFEYLLPVAGVATAATATSNTGSPSTSSGLNAMIHVLADSILLDGIFVASAMASSGLLEGYSLKREIIPQLQKDYLPAIRASLATSSLMAPIQYACFRYLPLSCRVFAMNVTDIIWDAVISFMSHRSRTDGTGHLIHKQNI